MRQRKNFESRNKQTELLFFSRHICDVQSVVLRLLKFHQYPADEDKKNLAVILSERLFSNASMHSILFFFFLAEALSTSLLIVVVDVELILTISRIIFVYLESNFQRLSMIKRCINKSHDLSKRYSILVNSRRARARARDYASRCVLFYRARVRERYDTHS